MQRHLEDAKSFYLGVYDRDRRDVPLGGDTDSTWSSELLKSLAQNVPPPAARRVRRARGTRSPA